MDKLRPENQEGMSPIYLDDILTIRDGTPRNEVAEQAIAAIARDIGDADALVLHRHAAKPIIALPFDTWRRLLLSVAVASGASPSIWVGD